MSSLALCLDLDWPSCQLVIDDDSKHLDGRQSLDALNCVRYSLVAVRRAPGAINIISWDFGLASGFLPGTNQ